MKFCLVDFREMSLVLVLFYLTLIAYKVEGARRTISEEMELEKQVKLLNKPAVKTIKTEHGEIFDCVDIYKQPAFDNPLLINHTLQMRPTSIPNGMIIAEDTSVDKHQQIGFKNEECPQGTVPIRRTRKIDLIRAKSLSNKRASYSSGNGYDVVSVKAGDMGPYYGAQAELNVYNPTLVADGQYSGALISMAHGPTDALENIGFGWVVMPQLYGDNKTRSVAFFVTKDRYCYNTQCAGFVQVNRRVPIGLVLNPVSTYHGDQREFKYNTFQDKANGNWWLVVGEANKVLGYWPKSLFTGLSQSAEAVFWSGVTYNPGPGNIAPQMGSGHFPNEGFRGAAYFKNLQISKGTGFEEPDPDSLVFRSDKPSCYDIGKLTEIAGSKTSFYYGGPGGSCG